MAQSGRELPANRAKTSDNGVGAGSEDHISALPDDVLVLILLRLGTNAAARTSVLSRRWLHVWTLLPELHFFDLVPGSHCIRTALSASEGALRKLSVLERNASPQSLAAWLPAAARRVSGELLLRESMDDEAEFYQRGTFELPCFEKATSILLDLGLLGLSMPLAGVFARLTELTLRGVRFHGVGELGDVVSSPRCPCLQKLDIYNVWGLDSITINSESLQLLDLWSLHGVRQLTVVAPALKALTLSNCFIDDQNQPAVNLSVPQLKVLEWLDAYDTSSVHLGCMERLESLGTFFFVYELDGFALPRNRACLMLLPQFKALKHLVLNLIYLPKIDALQYLMEDMTMLPDVTYLFLIVKAKGHAFGASSFHVLRTCSGIKWLRLILSDPSDWKEQSACLSGCICDQPTNWKTEKISLNHLQELEIEDFGASEHEFAFVKRLLNWVPMLKMMTVTFNRSITESKGKELFQMFRGFSRPGVCMEFYIYQEARKVFLAREDQVTRHKPHAQLVATHQL